MTAPWQGIVRGRESGQWVWLCDPFHRAGETSCFRAPRNQNAEWVAPLRDQLLGEGILLAQVPGVGGAGSR